MLYFFCTIHSVNIPHSTIVGVSRSSWSFAFVLGNLKLEFLNQFVYFLECMCIEYSERYWEIVHNSLFHFIPFFEFIYPLTDFITGFRNICIINVFLKELNQVYKIIVQLKIFTIYEACYGIFYLYLVFFWYN